MAMPTPTWKTKNDLCRCCHTEAGEACSFLSISEPVYNLGSTEIFTDILKSCFDINLLWVKGAETAMRICNMCVQRLRDANNFKKQVQLCEARFKEINYELLKDVLPAQIKLETCFDDEVKKEFPVSSDSEDDNDGIDVHFDDEVMKEFPVSSVSENDNGFDVNFVNNDDKKVQIKGNNTNTIKSAKPKAKSTALVVMKNSAPKSPNKTSSRAKAKKTEVGSILRKALSEPRMPFKIKPTDYEQDGDMYICKHCKEKFKQSAMKSLVDHVKSEHYNIQKYICPRCKEGFKTLTQFVTHKFEEHQIDDRWKCNHCDAVFNLKGSLHFHKLSLHKLGNKIKCEKCDFETYNPASMYKHKINHKTVRDHKCRFCGKAFMRKSTLNAHEKIHTNDRRKMCELCGQAFVQKASLNYHMAKYHPEVKF